MSLSKKYFICYNSLLALSYQKIGDGMTCEDPASLYTAVGGGACNGWEGISLTECEEKCTQNVVPSECEQQGIRCTYVHYDNDTNWCQLADDTCLPVGGEATFIITMKQGL